jgi:Xaa-Pro dipeptidase
VPDRRLVPRPLQPHTGVVDVAGTVVEFEVDEARMHGDRLARTRQKLQEHQLPAALLFDPLNVRYAVAAGPFAVFNMHVTFRWALVPVESEVVLWEYPRSMATTAARWSGDLREARGWTFFGSGRHSHEHAADFAAEVADVLRSRGLAGEAVGVDRLEAAGYLALTQAGVRVADAQPALEEARAVKTPDELAVIRTNAVACDRAITRMRDLLVPGVTENRLWGTLVGSALQEGAEWCETRLLSSGPRTNPWMQEATDRVVEDGDLVAFDTDLVGARGYLTDVSRTYLCGGRRPTDEQRRLYQTSYAFLQACLPELRPGAAFEELGRRLGPELPSAYHELRYPFIAHGTGLVDEYPCIQYEDHHPGELLSGMVISVESYVGVPGGHQGVKLEEQVIIGDRGPELISRAPFDEQLLA